MNKSLLVLLVISATVNVWLWQRLAVQLDRSNSLNAKLEDAESLRRQVQELEVRLRTTNAPASVSQINELARLRNEVGSLRQQLKDVKPQAPVPTSWRRMPATADWSEKFAAATNELARNEKYTEELSDRHDLLLSNLASASSQDLEDLKRRAQSRQCIQNLKRIGLTARIWANDHDDKFPPNHLTMREELETPGILFCPSGPSVPPSDWSQLNPSAISYPWQAASADARKLEGTITTCPLHGHLGMADGSVQSTRTNSSLW